MAGNRAREANGLLCITEKWVREHLSLHKDALDDVRSVSLPGSYYDKITHLGRSLVGFLRLKHLDLSRNALESLDGLEQLKHLETLNIYYNNIATLTELFKLRHNRKLKELDVRLNPVTKNEPDYRLFMVHMLVNLRKLDERGVRDTERRAALLHFDTDQANLFDRNTLSEQITPKTEQRSLKHSSSRKELVRSLAPRPSCIDNDTDELLDLMSRREQQANPPSPGPLNSSLSCGRPLSLSARYSEEPEERVQGNFTPAPAQPPTPHKQSSPGVAHERSAESAALEDLLALMQWFVNGDLAPLQDDSEFKDKFGKWFRAHVPPSSENEEKVNSLEQDIGALQQKLEKAISHTKNKEMEIKRLKSQLEQSVTEANLLSQQLEESRARLSSTSTQLEEMSQQLTEQLQQATAQNRSIKDRVVDLERENETLRSTLDQVPGDSHLDSLKQKISGLEVEKNGLRLKLDHAMERQREEADTSAQMQQLALMLQESHKSLVATNSHLLQELEECKHRHSQELSQMNHNYNSLRKAIDTYNMS